MATTLSREFRDLVASTQMAVHLENPVPDNYFDNHTLLEWAKGYGHIKRLDGGERIQVPLEVVGNDNAGSYASGDTFPTNNVEVTDTAFYQWKHYVSSVKYNGPDMRQNKGKWALFDFIKVRMNNSKKTLASILNRDGYANNTNPNNINGLDNLIATDPTTAAATLGEINPATATYWRNYVQTSLGSFASNGRQAMDRLIIQASRGIKDAEINFFLTHPDVVEYYAKLVGGVERVITEFKRGTVGSLSYKRYAHAGIPIEYDFACTSGVMYGLPMNYIYWYTLSSADFTPLDVERPHNQDSYVSSIISSCNFITSNRRHLGKITGITA